MIPETVANTKEFNQNFVDTLYQAYINNYIKRQRDFKQNPQKSYTVVWELCNKNLQKSIETNIYYEAKIQDNPIKILKPIVVLICEPERSKYPFASIT